MAIGHKSLTPQSKFSFFFFYPFAQFCLFFRKNRFFFFQFQFVGFEAFVTNFVAVESSQFGQGTFPGDGNDGADSKEMGY